MNNTEFLPSQETLATVKNKNFIISLPRTGTKSLIKMFMILGYKAAHCPSIRIESELQSGVNEVFADTPIYRPSLFLELAKEPTNKFVYIDRDINEWVNSFEATNLHNAYLDYITRPEDKLFRAGRLDRNSLREIFVEDFYTTELAKEKFNYHRSIVDTIPADQLLIYKLSDGWEPLCKFLGKDIPNENVPHINKGTLFEKIV